MLGLALAPGRRELLELLLAHRFDHLARGALELALRRVAALGRQGGTGGFLLGGGLGRHVPVSFRTENGRAGSEVPQASSARSSASQSARRAASIRPQSTGSSRSPGAICSGQCSAMTPAIRSSFKASTRKRGSTVTGSTTTRRRRQAGPPPLAIDCRTST